MPVLIFLAVKDKNKLDTDASNLRDKEKVCHQFVHDIARGNVSIPDIAVSFNIKKMYAKIAKQAKKQEKYTLILACLYAYTGFCRLRIEYPEKYLKIDCIKNLEI